MITNMKFILFLLLTLSFHTFSITLDGILDEEQWQNAQHFNKMILVKPYVLSAAKYPTEIWVTSDEKGIYFGIKNFQTIESRNTDISARDQIIGSDKNQLIIDFDNNGIVAYSFEVGIGGSIRDGIFSNENKFSNEWDGNWSAKTSRHPDYWVSEILIPWDVVSMKKAETDVRKLKWYLSRTIVGTNEVYAIVAADDSRQRFISKFTDLYIKDFATSSFSLFGYASARRDFYHQTNSSDIGLDVFWKSGNGKQLTATVNPDFGQIESDRLVVNFSATETFFNERRPFFTENQSLFDVQGANGLRLLHTRRIGARPDTGIGNVSDIGTAIKYTDNRDNFNYGIMAAFESSGIGYQGRDYFAGRALYRRKSQIFGLTASIVDRVDIDRAATSLAFDHEYLLGNDIKLKSQIIGTSISQNNQNTNGKGGWIKAQQQLTPNQNHFLEISHYDAEFEINDFGFLPRNNLNTLLYHYVYKQTKFAKPSSLQQHQYIFDLFHQGNDNGEVISRTYFLDNIWQFKNTSSLGWHIRYKEKGSDDLISRGNGNLITGAGYQTQVSYFSSKFSKLRYHAFYKHLNYFSQGKGFDLHLHPSYFFKENYSASLNIFYSDYQDWVNWLKDDLFGRYNRKLLNASLDFNANISQKQELRFRFQWLAIDAQANQEYRLNTQGNLLATGQKLKSFSLSNTALQLRYRYEFTPLSNLYIVYSRGGRIFEEASNNLQNLFEAGFSNVTGNNFLVKLRWKFF